jgi:hypothetical protein
MDRYSDEETYLAEAQRKAKQNYLREAVLEGNLPVDEFTDYIDKKRGANIDLWTLTELEQCVREFKERVKHLPSKLVIPQEVPSMSQQDSKETADLPPQETEEAKAEDLPEELEEQESAYTYNTAQLDGNELSALGPLTVSIAE